MPLQAPSRLYLLAQMKWMPPVLTVQPPPALRRVRTRPSRHRRARIQQWTEQSQLQTAFLESVSTEHHSAPRARPFALLAHAGPLRRGAPMQTQFEAAAAATEAMISQSPSRQEASSGHQPARGLQCRHQPSLRGAAPPQLEAASRGPLRFYVRLQARRSSLPGLGHADALGQHG